MIFARIGPVTAEAAHHLGIAATIMPERYTIPDLVDTLVLAFSGALLQAGMGLMTYTEMGERLDAAVAVKKPHGIGFAEAATVPLAGCTALYAVRDYGQVTSGQHVLINGAGGGVGVHAVQLAKHFGATVTAVCSEAKRSLMHDIGADHVIDYRKHDFTAGSTRYDAIVDTISSQTVRRCRRGSSARRCPGTS